MTHHRQEHHRQEHHRQGIVLFAVLALTFGCGGGGGDSQEPGTVVQGTLIQGETSEVLQRRGTRLAHSAGQVIEDVEICALAACVRTDSLGRWGFAVEALTERIDFTISGHGINDVVPIVVPTTAKTIEIEFENLGSAGVFTHEVLADGIEIPQPESGHEHGEDDHGEEQHEDEEPRHD